VRKAGRPLTALELTRFWREAVYFLFMLDGMKLQKVY
jgi:hypothetical protein